MMLDTDVQAPPPVTPAEPESRDWTWMIVGLVVVALMVVAGAIGWWLGSGDDEETVETAGVATVTGPVEPQDAVPPMPVQSRPTGGTALPDFVGVVAGDDGFGPAALGVIDELPESERLDFLFEFCQPDCDRDAHFMDPNDPSTGSGTWAADRPFHVRHGFINNSDDPLGEGYDVALYVTRLDEFTPDGPTYRYTSDHVIRETADQCGPTYKTQRGAVSCERFVHDFPEGLPQGRWAMWAVWEAPCSAWVELGLTESCEDADEVMSLFSSGFDAPFGSFPPDFSERDQRFMTPDELAQMWVPIPSDGFLMGPYVEPAIVGPAGTPGSELEVFVEALAVPNDLEFDPDGALYVAETRGSRVSRVEILADGSASEPVVVGTGIPEAEGLALSEGGVLYVGDGAAVYRIVDGVTERFTDGFADAEGVAIDANGDLYVADDAQPGIRITRIEVLDDGGVGEVTEIAVLPGFTAADIDFGPSGELYVADDVDGVWALTLTEDTETSRRWIGPIPGGPRALAFDDTGTLYVGTDDYGHEGAVWTVEPAATPEVLARGFNGVEGLALDSDGTLYAVDVGRNRVLIVE